MITIQADFEIDAECLPNPWRMEYAVSRLYFSMLETSR